MSEKYNEYLKLLKIYMETEDFSGAVKMAEKMIEEEPLSYDAHFFKAMAMSRLISYENQIVSDVIKSVYTAYKVLNSEGQNAKRDELANIMGMSFLKMVDVILSSFEKKRPTEQLTLWVIKSTEEMTEEFNKSLSYIDVTDKTEYILHFKNRIATKVNYCIARIWKETVWADYSKDACVNGKWTNPDYRPDEKIMLTFAKEAMYLVSLLSFSEKNINETTPPKDIYAIYNNKSIIAYQIPKAAAYTFHKQICKNGIMMYNHFEISGMLPDKTREKYQAIAKKYDALADEYENKISV